MKNFLNIVVLAGVLALLYYGCNAYKTKKAELEAQERVSMGLPPKDATNAPVKLPGMNPAYEANLEKSLEAAKGSAAALNGWLKQYRVYVADPRLADIELDYVLLIGRTDPAEAKRVFADVRRRTPPNSPVYERVKRLSRTYE
ncbi:MAG: hypothetical protein HYY24_18650 [Verrucomicrobia bacterium]|nr:hypothetical protein [Verrucomicrobiota bacterium]